MYETLQEKMGTEAEKNTNGRGVPPPFIETPARTLTLEDLGSGVYRGGNWG